MEDVGAVKEDSDYEAMIAKLYKPAVKPVEKPAEEPAFQVNVPENPEPAVIEEEKQDDTTQPSLLQGIKRWLNQYVQNVVE